MQKIRIMCEEASGPNGKVKHETTGQSALAQTQ